MKCFLFLGFLLNIQLASATICRVQLPRTACGTGQVMVQFDLSSLLFNSEIGDIGCWYGPSFISGQMIKLAMNTQYVDTKTYSLFITKDTKEYATLIYDYKKSVAKFILKDQSQNPGVLSKEYNLKCEDKNEESDPCLEQCGRLCTDRPIFCGQW